MRSVYATAGCVRSAFNTSTRPTAIPAGNQSQAGHVSQWTCSDCLRAFQPLGGDHPHPLTSLNVFVTGNFFHTCGTVGCPAFTPSRHLTRPRPFFCTYRTTTRTTRCPVVAMQRMDAPPLVCPTRLRVVHRRRAHAPSLSVMVVSFNVW
jgi:hypothetical protein